MPDTLTETSRAPSARHLARVRQMAVARGGESELFVDRIASATSDAASAELLVGAAAGIEAALRPFPDNGGAAAEAAISATLAAFAAGERGEEQLVDAGLVAAQGALAAAQGPAAAPLEDREHVATPPRSRNAVGASWDVGHGLRARMVDGLLARVAEDHEPTIGRDFSGMTLVDMAQRCLAEAGRRSPYGGRAALVEMALHSTSDFPAVLGGAMNRVLLSAYEEDRSPLIEVSRETSAMDFKTLHAIRLSGGPGLEKVAESGEFARGTIEEGEETFALETFGRVFGITRQALVNDDLGAFENMGPLMGRAASHTEGKVLAGILTLNSGAGPTMKDDLPLFHENHGNLAASGGALSVETLSAARTAMRRQKGLAGETINVTPRFIVVPPELETAADKVVAELTAADADKVNPFSGRLGVLVDPNLESETRWYIAAAPGRPDGLQHAYLDGQKGPQFFQREGFDVDGIEFKVRLDFGAGFVDHRAWYMNPGA